MSKKIKSFICAIDGSSASGKSTMAKMIGKKYRWSVLYTGLLYRYAAKILLDKNPKDEVKFLNKIFSKINYEKIKGINLHNSKISSYSSVVAQKRKVRAIIKKYQLSYVKKKKKVVLEGRDMSQIFPHADVKFFVVCKPLKIAARRRFLQLKKTTKNITLKEVNKELLKRDNMDRHRKISPLVKAADSWYINTAKLNIRAVINKSSSIIDLVIKKKYGN